MDSCAQLYLLLIHFHCSFLKIPFWHAHAGVVSGRSRLFLRASACSDIVATQVTFWGWRGEVGLRLFCSGEQWTSVSNRIHVNNQGDSSTEAHRDMGGQGITQEPVCATSQDTTFSHPTLYFLCFAHKHFFYTWYLEYTYAVLIPDWNLLTFV